MKNKIYGVLIVLMIAAFCVTRPAVAADSVDFRWEKSETSATLYDGDQLVFAFQYAFLDHFPLASENDPRRFAGDYIYPLNGLDGENLVDNAPKDHYHHHGVFWTWPGVFVHNPDGTTQRYDLWTSNTQIRQRFVKFLAMEASEEEAVLSVENGWYIGEGALKPDEELDPSKKGEAISENERFYGDKIMTEIVTITTRHVESLEDVACRSVDVELTLVPTDRPVSLQGAAEKSYGGLTIRFKPVGEIGKDRFITTDDGVASDDMPEKRLRWADYTSRFGDQDTLSGAAIFLSPNFPDFPPTWLTRYYGPLCVGYPGVEAQRYEPGKPIVMKARIWVHRGLVSTEILKSAFENWAQSEGGE
ncbi:MAG: DUF6807 family protein [Thermoguttaceae bacterium]|jgi:hypothetical protein